MTFTTKWTGAPVVVAVPQPALARWASLVAGHLVVPVPLTARRLLRAVRDATGRAFRDGSVRRGHLNQAARRARGFVRAMGAAVPGSHAHGLLASICRDDQAVRR